MAITKRLSSLKRREEGSRMSDDSDDDWELAAKALETLQVDDDVLVYLYLFFSSNIL